VFSTITNSSETLGDRAAVIEANKKVAGGRQNGFWGSHVSVMAISPKGETCGGLSAV
jgi:hypothetical protein